MGCINFILSVAILIMFFLIGVNVAMEILTLKPEWWVILVSLAIMLFIIGIGIHLSVEFSEWFRSKTNK